MSSEEDSYDSRDNVGNPAVSGSTNPTEVSESDNGLLDLSRQLRNLVLLRPLFQFEFNKGRLGSDSGSDSALFLGLDTSYLCLAALDFMMEATAISNGARPDDVLGHLRQVALSMKPSLPLAQAHEVAEITLAVLNNKADGHKEFSFEYFDATSARNLSVDFRLVRYMPDLEDTYRYIPTNEGYLVYLGMLDLTGEIGQELMEKFLSMLIERGSFQSAQETAQAARKISLGYRQRIQERLLQAYRSPGSVNWSRDLSPFLGNAREHVSKRQLEDLRMEESVREAMLQVEDPRNRRSLSRLIETLKSSAYLRTELVTEIAKSGDQFLSAQRMLFRARRPSGLPDLEDQTLPRLMDLSVGDLSDAADDLVSTLYPPQWPKVYDLNTVCALLLEHRVEDGALVADDGELVPYKEPEPQFPKAMVAQASAWVRAKVEQTREWKLSQLMAAAETEGRSASWIHCMVFTAFELYTVHQSGVVRVRVSAGGRFSHDLASGTDLHFAPEAPATTSARSSSPVASDTAASTPENKSSEENPR